MYTPADKTQENKTQSVANAVSQKQNRGESTFQFIDNRPEAVVQKKLQEMAKNSQQVSQLRALQEMASNGPQVKEAAQLQELAYNYSIYANQHNQKEGNIIGNVIQRTINHVTKYGCEEEEAVGKNFETHTPSRVKDPFVFSANRGAVPNSIVHITDRQLAEEVAAELYTWPIDWKACNEIWITSIQAYDIAEYYDGELIVSYRRKFKFKCQLRRREDGSQYYEVYHYGGSN